ncbi:hypothetical protein CC86DRAFT_416739 [Ophiobolus disseminans]|uniref:RING-type domain-containing protein n=1 Tax=Ophiobolus disseminans TaxID=1469910 RepID=A0A6A7A2L8_9PLEO|nr:hypothetical protein CC86DRAFT_416739 [Ophiobolus disseminans]
MTSSSTPQVPTDHVESNVDGTLTGIDARSVDEPTSIKRSQAARDNAVALLGFPQTPRLMYRPQPSPSQFERFENFSRKHERDPLDVSFMFFPDVDTNLALSLCHQLKEYSQGLQNIGVQFLTLIDTKAASSPDEKCSDLVERTVALLLETNRSAERDIATAWRKSSEEDSDYGKWYNWRANCSTYMFGVRDRSQHKANAYRIGCSDDFAVLTEINELKTLYVQRMHQLMDDFEANVELEWVEPHILVEDIPTPISNSEGVDCIVCRGITPPEILTKPYGHPYCKECLEAWIYATQTGSHKCPYCRTELFPKPEYRFKEPEKHTNYEREIHRHEFQAKHVCSAWLSATWFAKEMDLQRAFEEDVAHAGNNAQDDQPAAVAEQSQ